RLVLSGIETLGRLYAKKEPLVQLWEVATGQCVRTFEGNAPLAISPDGRFALCGRGEKLDGPAGPCVIHRSRLLLWDVATGQCLHTFEGDKYTDGVNALTFSPDGRFALSGSDNKLRLWDRATRECLRAFEGHTDSVESVAFSPD